MILMFLEVSLSTTDSGILGIGNLISMYFLRSEKILKVLSVTDCDKLPEKSYKRTICPSFSSPIMLVHRTAVLIILAVKKTYP